VLLSRLPSKSPVDVLMDPAVPDSANHGGGSAESIPITFALVSRSGARVRVWCGLGCRRFSPAFPADGSSPREFRVWLHVIFFARLSLSHMPPNQNGVSQQRGGFDR
jgi:hypothetical protein